MTAPVRPAPSRPLTGKALFPKLSRVHFAASYPEGPHKLRHNLGANPLFQLDALAELAERLPAHAIECTRGDLPIGAGETIRGIETNESRAVLKNIEREPAYAALLNALLGELRDEIVARTGKLVKPQAFVFVSSPEAVTPFHFDPEHTILLQLQGEKTMTLFPAGDPGCAPNARHEAWHTGDAHDSGWDEAFASLGARFRLVPGEAIYVPFMAPHHVENGPAPSISLSITWRSAWSFAEADARAFNAYLRGRGFDPRPPGRWPARNRAKAIAWRVLRRMPGIG